MKSLLKVFSIIIISIVVIIIATFAGARYGWKMFGFKFCNDPNLLFATNVSVADDKVNVSGDVGNSISSFVGYTYKIQDNKMYIGIKENILFGFHERLGRFDISIDCDTTKLESIYFKNSKSEKRIWHVKEQTN